MTKEELIEKLAKEMVIFSDVPMDYTQQATIASDTLWTLAEAEGTIDTLRAEVVQLSRREEVQIERERKDKLYMYEFRAEVERLEKQYADWCDGSRGWQDRAEKAEAELKTSDDAVAKLMDIKHPDCNGCHDVYLLKEDNNRLRVALEKIADPDAWFHTNGEPGGPYTAWGNHKCIGEPDHIAEIALRGGSNDE